MHHLSRRSPSRQLGYTFSPAYFPAKSKRFARATHQRMPDQAFGEVTRLSDWWSECPSAASEVARGVLVIVPDGS